MSGHTPGPWLQCDTGDRRTVYTLTPDGTQNRFWASVHSVGRAKLGEATTSECIANARLIAAAPDLLAAARNALALLFEVHSEIHGGGRVMDSLSAAIAKAEGAAS